MTRPPTRSGKITFSHHDLCRHAPNLQGLTLLVDRTKDRINNNAASCKKQWTCRLSGSIENRALEGCRATAGSDWRGS